jgi:hypothetical protein
MILELDETGPSFSHFQDQKITKRRKVGQKTIVGETRLMMWSALTLFRSIFLLTKVKASVDFSQIRGLVFYLLYY